MNIFDNEDIVQGYDGSCHAPSSALASSKKLEGHGKEDVFAKIIGGSVVKGRKKPDVIKGDDRYSIKGARKNVQIFLLAPKKGKEFYGSKHPIYKFQLAG